MRIITHAWATPFGELLLGSWGEELCLCDWRYRRMRTAVDARIQRGLGAEYVVGNSAVIVRAKEELEGYFNGERKEFSIPLRLVGTPFQRTVWQALLNVPYGTASTYQGLTQQVAEPTAIRAVASANGANGLSIFVPCHRIIGRVGALVGYAGGLSAKRQLLQLEGAMSTTTPDLFSYEQAS